MEYNLEFFGINPEEVAASLERDKADRKGDPRVCACGHGARSHSSHALRSNILQQSLREAGEDRCLPNRQTCPCDGFRAVLTTGDIRLFRYRTSGAYNDHALAKGIRSAIEKGVAVSPISEWRCDFCTRTDSVGAVPVNKYGKEVSEPGLKNFLMCPEHVRLLRVGELFAKSS